MALDALDGDSEFLSRTCDCRTILAAERAERRKIALELRHPTSENITAEGAKPEEEKESEGDKDKEGEAELTEPEASGSGKDDDETPGDLEMDVDPDEDDNDSMENGEDETNT